jgi:hypothetical protein
MKQKENAHLANRNLATNMEAKDCCYCIKTNLVKDIAGETKIVLK